LQHARAASVGLAAALSLLSALTGCEGTSDTIAIPREQAAADASTSIGDACPGPASADDGVVALYPFDGDEGRSQVADAVGDHNGSVQQGLVTTVAGPEGCGRAFAFGEQRYVVIDDSPSWDLEAGSIDLWLWLPAELTDHAGVLSRDQQNRDDPGHFTLFVDDAGHALARVQPASESGELDALPCSEAVLPREQWLHIGVNFGPPEVELYIDGELVEGLGPSTLRDECGQNGPFGIAGNDLPWVLGRATHHSEGILDTLELPATGFAVDHVRISSVRRDFAAFR
jgi:hypothetical protein